MLLFAIAAMAAAQPAALPPTQLGRPDELCPRGFNPVAGRPAPAPRKLGELPPGRAMLTVNKTVGGCPVAVLMQRDANGDRIMTPSPSGVSRTPTGR